MIHLTQINGDWKQITLPTLTDEQKNLLRDTNPDNDVARKYLRETLQSTCYTPAASADAISAQSIFDVNNIIGSALIAVNIILPNGNGVINCRVGGEHKQIRF